MELISLLGLLALNLGYISYILYMNDGKSLHSISDSWYILKPHKQHHLFTIYCFLMAIGLVFLSNLHELFFLSGVGFGFVGTATQFKNTSWYIDEIHYGGAVVGIGSALLGLWSILSPLPLILFLGGSILLYLGNKEKDRYIFWIEIYAITIILWTLFLL